MRHQAPDPWVYLRPEGGRGDLEGTSAYPWPHRPLLGHTGVKFREKTGLVLTGFRIGHEEIPMVDGTKTKYPHKTGKKILRHAPTIKRAPPNSPEHPKASKQNKGPNTKRVPR
jgi:hypothetical protein